MLKKGGHFCISDAVLNVIFPKEFTDNASMYAGCIASAIQREDYLGEIEKANFSDIKIERTKTVNSSIPIEKKKDSDMSRNPYLDKLGICDKELEQYTCCPITGLPFFVEDIKSKYLSRKQIWYYYNNYPEVYSLLIHMISIEYNHIPLENQIEKIAQATRNKASYLKRKKKKDT